MIPRISPTIHERERWSEREFKILNKKQGNYVTYLYRESACTKGAKFFFFGKENEEEDKRQNKTKQTHSGLVHCIYGEIKRCRNNNNKNNHSNTNHSDIKMFSLYNPV